LEAYAKTQQRILNQAQGSFGFGKIIYGLTVADEIAAEQTLQLIKDHYAEIERAQKDFLKLTKDVNALSNFDFSGGRGTDRAASDAVINDAANIKLPPPPKPKPNPLTDEEGNKIKELADKYDEFGGKVRNLTKDFADLKTGVAGHLISAEAASRAYNGMVNDIVKAAASSDDFNTIITQSKQALELVNDAVANHGKKVGEAAGNYRTIIDGMVKAAAASGDFDESVSNSAKTVGQISAALRTYSVSADFANVRIAALVRGMSEVAVSAGTFEQAVANSNLVLKQMEILVNAGLLPLSEAQKSYHQLGEALLTVRPNQEKLRSEQEAWNTLIANSITPVEEYTSKLEELSRAASTAIKADPSRAGQAIRQLQEGAAIAADKYHDALLRSNR